MVSRWTPTIRSVLRIELPSTRRERQRVAFSSERRMEPRGRSGMRPNVLPHALHFRRALPSRSFPQPMVRPGQEMEAGAVMASLNWIYCSTNSATVKRENRLICGTIGATVVDMPRGRPKADRTYSVMLRVRVAPEHDELIREAADSAAARKGSGDMSSWIRETLVAAARKELAREGKGDRTPSA